MATIQSETDCYDIIEVLGKGTFGEVAKGWRRSTGEMVAIKILKNDAYRNRIIKNELKLLRCMRGLDPEEAHIIRFLEFFHDALKFYLVFELLEQNLFEFQKENNFAPLPARHIRTVTLQVLRALARLKELAIIHADLKPENIMLVDQTRCPFRVKVRGHPGAAVALSHTLTTALSPGRSPDAEGTLVLPLSPEVSPSWSTYRLWNLPYISVPVLTPFLPQRGGLPVLVQVLAWLLWPSSALRG